MKKIFKKILTTCCAGVLSLVLLSGCSWAKIDSEKYYNLKVASIGDMSFTKKDLIEAFNNYGYQYYQNYGYDMETAVEETITSMIDRALLLEEVKSIEKYNLTDEEKLILKQSVFDYIQETVSDYEDDVREEWDMEIKTETPEDGESLRVEKEEYTPSTEYVLVKETVKVPVYSTTTNADGDYDVIDEIEETRDVYRVNVIEDDDDEVFVRDGITLDTHFSKSMLVVTNERVTNEAWTRYIKALQDSAKNEGRSTKEADVLRYEEDRLYKLMEDNKYLEKFKNDYHANNYYDVSAVLDTYRENYKSQMASFKADESTYHSTMKDSASSEYIYYHANSGNEYVNVKHILIKFSDAQTQEITDLKAEYSIGDDYETGSNLEYDRRLNEIASSARTMSTFELNGKTMTWSAKDVYSYVKNHVTGDAKQRSTKFDELIYVFNDDDGMMNSAFDYVVNLDTDVEDAMVKPFADGVRALDKSNGGEGAGSMDMVLTEYGWHILFHDGNAKNIVGENEIDNISDEELLNRLCNTYTTPNSNKSIFNYIYDTLSDSSRDTAYNNMTAELVSDIRTRLANQDVVVKLYVKNYKDLIGD